MKKKFPFGFKKWPLRAAITKRQKFILTAALLSTGLLLIEVTNISWRYLAISLLALTTYLLSAWSLKEGLKGIEWLVVLILPTLFTAGVGLFYFLISASWLTKLPVILLYALGIYTLLLTENIFSVAAIRTIQLLRSAQAVGFLLTIVAAFFLYDTILAFRLDPWFNSLLVALVSLPLVVQGLWCVGLEERISRRAWIDSLGLSLALGEMALAFSFWPLTVAVGSLGLTTALYVLLGLNQHSLHERLFRKTINEYVGVGIAVLLVLVLTTKWGG